MSTRTTTAGATRAGETSTGRHSTGLRWREALAGYLFVAPFFVVFLAMLVVPLFYSG